jgi:hypothetical protein
MTIRERVSNVFYFGQGGPFQGHIKILTGIDRLNSYSPNSTKTPSGQNLFQLTEEAKTASAEIMQQV